MIMTMIREEMKRDGWQCSWHPRPLLKMTQPYTSVIMMVMKMMMQMAMVMFRWWWWWWGWKWWGWWWGWRGWKTKGGRFPRQADLQRTEIESRALGCSYGICLKSENVFQLMDDFVFVFGYQVFSNADIKWWYHQYPSSVQVIWKSKCKRNRSPDGQKCSD